jgi:trehalose 6-phosphate phosphatase
VRRTRDGFLTDGPSRRHLQAPPPLDAGAALFLDVDGTLLDIVARADLVQVPSELPGLLARTASQRGGALALVSGRPLDQLDRLFRPWRGAAAGLHGIERRRPNGTVDRRIDAVAATALEQVRPRLAALAAADNGLILEDKGATVALHYREAPDRAAEILAAAQALQHETAAALRLIPGKMVVEFQPRGADKGTTIAAYLAEAPFRGRIPVFVGDDVTDEDGFAEIDRRRGLAVRVGQPAETRAGHALPSVAAVLAWLAGDQYST